MKRKLFEELKEGFGALQSVRENKLTLRECIAEKEPELGLPDSYAPTVVHLITENMATPAKILI